MRVLEIFFFIQLLDFMTTLVGLRMGGTEMSPFARLLMQFDPVLGLTVVKLIGFGLGAYCVATKRIQVITKVNYIFAAIVVWNLHNILKAVTSWGPLVAMGPPS